MPAALTATKKADRAPSMLALPAPALAHLSIASTQRRLSLVAQFSKRKSVASDTLETI